MDIGKLVVATDIGKGQGTNQLVNSAIQCLGVDQDEKKIESNPRNGESTSLGVQACLNI